MKPIIKFSAFLLSGIILLISCQKKFVCPDCDTNQPPIANAGMDQKIVLPKDSLMLDGSASIDHDGTIVKYKWIKIFGPVSSNILKSDSSRTLVKTLVMGVYQFELSVTDNGGLSAKDTMQIIVNDSVQSNRPPIANAGADQNITLPTNAINLDGNGSTDPDNNITTYAWTKISGPSSYSVANMNAVQAQVTNLVQGIYEFELKVTDSAGLFSNDTMKVTVDTVVSQVSYCTPFNRPIVNAQLIPFGTLSEARSFISVASAGNKILFAGGLSSSGMPSSAIDIYNITTQGWSTAQLSEPRTGISAIGAGNKIYFAGGDTLNKITGDWRHTARVDIYDVASNTWSTAQLSEARTDIAVATVGNKILFAGGFNGHNCSICFSNKVDIYDQTSNIWSVGTLSIARAGLAATTAGNKIYFAGGNDLFAGNNGTGVYDRIDIYDNTTNTWSTSALYERKGHPASIALGNYIYWAGGETWGNMNDYETTCLVERRDLTTGTSTITHLFQPSNSNRYYWRIEGLLKNGLIVIYSGLSEFDIYNPVNEIWAVGTLNQSIDDGTIISVNNIIYVAGGTVNGYVSNQVWKLDF